MEGWTAQKISLPVQVQFGGSDSDVNGKCV